MLGEKAKSDICGIGTIKQNRKTTLLSKKQHDMDGFKNIRIDNFRGIGHLWSAVELAHNKEALIFEGEDSILLVNLQ